MLKVLQTLHPCSGALSLSSTACLPGGRHSVGYASVAGRAGRQRSPAPPGQHLQTPTPGMNQSVSCSAPCCSDTMGMFDSAIARLSGRTDLEKQREKERQRQRQVQERQLEERKRKQEQDWRQEARGGNGGAARFAPPKLTRTPSGRETAGRVALHGTGAKEAPALPWGAGAPRGVHTLAELHQRDAEQCAGCKLLIWEDSRHLTAMDKAWHVGCFKCGACRLALTGSYIPKDGQPYHAGCYKEQFHPHCSVCASYLPEDEVGAAAAMPDGPA